MIYLIKKSVKKLEGCMIRDWFLSKTISYGIVTIENNQIKTHKIHPYF